MAETVAHTRRIHAGRRRVRSHASGIGSAVAVVSTLEVTRRREGDDVVPVRDREHRELGPLELLLDHDGGATASETALNEHRVDRGVRLIDARADDHTFASREPIRLDRDLALTLAGPLACGRR